MKCYKKKCQHSIELDDLKLSLSLISINQILTNLLAKISLTYPRGLVYDATIMKISWVIYWVWVPPAFWVLVLSIIKV